MSNKITWDLNPVEENIDFYSVFRDGLIIATPSAPPYIDEVGIGGSYSLRAVAKMPSPVKNIRVEPITVPTFKAPRLMWMRQLTWKEYPDDVRKTLQIHKGFLYASKHVFAGVPPAVKIDPSTGTAIWSSGYRSDRDIVSNNGFAPICNGKMYVTTGHEPIGRVIDIETGAQKEVTWGQCGPTSVYSVADDTGIYGYGIRGCNSLDNPCVSALNPAGIIRWQSIFTRTGTVPNFPPFGTPQYPAYQGGVLPQWICLGMPAIDDKYVYVPMGRLNRFDKKTGEMRSLCGFYPGEGGATYFGTPKIFNGLIYATFQIGVFGPQLACKSIDGSNVSAHDALPYSNCRSGISQNLSRAIDPLSFEVDDSGIYMRSDSELCKIGGWKVVIGNPYLANNDPRRPLTGPLVLTDDAIYTIHNYGVFAFAKDTGALLWAWHNPRDVIMSHQVRDGNKLYAIDNAGNVFGWEI